MNYRNAEMKIDQLVSYLNESKINLAPPFQRGHVWSVSTRRRFASEHGVKEANPGNIFV